MEITRLMVHSEYLRQGVGSALLEYVLDSDPNISSFVVTAGIANIPAVRLYEKYGFAASDIISVIAGTQLTQFRLNR
ncbi:Acetyltransferase (GNAT) family protein [compost metagenome]